ncbi:hypothetical protein N7494_001762 [Penicillium frequentans]|uniref:Peptidase C14 caspase domain-containing protein n=1 Tax=Penicillium frequentans TaxID=3151616 RepID=A0AAD6GI55_9EURO|nr:hypothetical protein N7494_001762 [Penicillium glabrum]
MTTKTPPVPSETVLAQLQVLALKDETPRQIAVDTDAEPPAYDHIPDYKTLEQDLSRAAQKALANLKKGRKYDKALVLAIYWHKDLTDRPHIASDAEKLLKVFHSKFGYQTNRHVLESEDTYKALNRRLVNLEDQLGSKTEENLLILYYGGHGGFDNDDSKARLWLPNLHDAARTIDWNKLQSQLEEADFDILFLFDCCYAMSMPNRKLKWRKRCEVVGSSGPREKAGGRPDTSFTAAVIELLEDDYEKVHETNAWRIGTIMKARDHKRALKSTPDYEALSEGYVTIPLVPMDGNLVSSDSSSSGSSRTHQDMLTFSDARIIFSLAMTNVPAGRDFQRMLEFMPPEVKGIDVKVVPSQKILDSLGIFRGNSALAFLSVPVWFWCAMYPNSVYNCIGLIRSKNLLEEDPIEAGQQALIANYCSIGMQTEERELRSLPITAGFAISQKKESHSYLGETSNSEAAFGREDKSDLHHKRTTVAWKAQKKRLFTPTQSAKIETSIQKKVSGISTDYITNHLAKVFPEQDERNASSSYLSHSRKEIKVPNRRLLPKFQIHLGSIFIHTEVEVMERSRRSRRPRR